MLSESPLYFTQGFCGLSEITSKYTNFAYMSTMSKYQIPYTNACIRAFGRRFAISTKDAYLYLRKFRGIAFLVEFYEAEHLQSIEDAVDDLIIYCRNNGGYLS